MIYLQLDNNVIKGEANDSSFKDSIEVRTFSHSFKQAKSATSSSAGGATAARAEFEDVFLTKHLDLASPLLYAALAGGKTFNEAVITFLRADAANATSSKPINYLVVKIKNVLVASITVSHQDESQLPVETLGLRGTALSWTYTKQALGGGQSGSSQGSWNLAQNTNSYS